MNRDNILEVILIRHGKTCGNTQGRYIGAGTDESLCGEGIEELQIRQYPQVEKIYASPLKRCIETAEVLYKGQIPEMVELLKECDFGLFENKNAKELSTEPLYQQWIDSGGTLPFPKGESPENFKQRSLAGFEQILKSCRKERLLKIAIVAHGGTIMSIMEAYGKPEEEYFHWQVKNGDGYKLYLKEDTDHEMDHVGGGVGICTGSSVGRSQMDVSSSENDRKPDFLSGKNYQKLFA